jgi:hypothetical protein
MGTGDGNIDEALWQDGFVGKRDGQSADRRAVGTLAARSTGAGTDLTPAPPRRCGIRGAIGLCICNIG